MVGARPTSLIDPNTLWSNNLSLTDGAGFSRNPAYRYVYDKLWVAMSQGIPCGPIKTGPPPRRMRYPVFVKPRWGHMTAQSRGCVKVSGPREWAKIKSGQDQQELMWSAYLDEKEGMCDLVMDDGRIVHHQTYLYGPTEDGYTDAWKYIAHDTPLLPGPVLWATNHLHGYTGFVNLQYRGQKIFEAALRPARTGMYLRMTGSVPLVDSINRLADDGVWEDGNFAYDPFYVFKCICPRPILSLPPQALMGRLNLGRGGQEFSEYYFEDVGKAGVGFYQFTETDLARGLAKRELVQRSMVVYQGLPIMFGALAMFCFLASRRSAAVGAVTLVALVQLAGLSNTTTALAAWKKMGRSLPISSAR